MATQSTNHTLRIIGGNWRGRKVSFAHHQEVRPTPDRVRETLFNWLQGHLTGARCLELYAGSGILSLEALSRGAKEVVLLDISEKVITHLSTEFRRLRIPEQHYQLVNQPARQWLSRNLSGDAFDIVFLDPPFTGDELVTVLDSLSSSQLVIQGGWAYVESEYRLKEALLPESWVIHRQKKAGAVHYCLCKSLPPP